MTHVLRSRAVGLSTHTSENSSKPSLPHVASPAKALRLVYCDESGNFILDAEAVATLQLVKGPLGVVSVCGRARQGKSFILNQLLGRSSGFQVASTHRPCTKGLWMWSTPLKRTAPDGTEYSLLLLDSEGIDAYDQTGTYSTQIFSLAVLLSSMFIYNQMGGIDEAALDRLSLVTEMTKHIRVRASQHRPSAAELGQFSPIFLWLLRDFYLDLTEDGGRISPRDYLESALQPISGSGKAIAAKNDIRDSIRALFPDRDCFTLVRPLNDERDLQRLDQIPLERLRPEFHAGLDALTRFIFERTKPKQVGSIIMTGPLLAGLIQSFLDAINAGAVPTIATSWQNVEESECRRAYDEAMESYIKILNESTLTDEDMLREIHEGAAERALGIYNSEAVGAGAARHKYERLLNADLRRYFKENMRKVVMEAEMKCAQAVETMDLKLRSACQSPAATIDQLLEVLDSLVVGYEQTAFGPTKWKKLVKFLQQSIEGPLLDIMKTSNCQSDTENTSLQLKCQSLEDRVSNLGKQLDSANRDVQDWKRRYEAIAADSKSSEGAAVARYMALQKTHDVMEEKLTAVCHEIEAARNEASDWRSRYENLMSERHAEEQHAISEMAALQSRCSAAEGRLAAVREQLESAKEEAAEWRRKHEASVEEYRILSEKATATCERISKHGQSRQDALRAELSSTTALKEKELRGVQAKVEEDERRLAGLQTHLEDQKAKVNEQEEELVLLRSELGRLKALVDTAKATALSSQRELEIFKKEKSQQDTRLNTELKRLEEAERNCKLAERNSKTAIEQAKRARDEASQAEREKLHAQRLAIERLAALERAESQSEALAREKQCLSEEVERVQFLEQEAVSRVKSLEKQLEDSEKEMEDLLDSANEQRANAIKVYETLLASERQACNEANARAEALSLQLQATQGKFDSLQQKYSITRLNETVMDSKLRARHGEQAGDVRGKRHRGDGNGHGETVQDMEVDPDNINPIKKPCVSGLENDNSPLNGLGDLSKNNDETHDLKDVENYLRFTISRLKQEITKAGFGDELLRVQNPSRKEFVNLYEKLVLGK